jgi:hypothetical protein
MLARYKFSSCSNLFYLLIRYHQNSLTSTLSSGVRETGGRGSEVAESWRSSMLARYKFSSSTHLFYLLIRHHQNSSTSTLSSGVREGGGRGSEVTASWRNSRPASSGSRYKYTGKTAFMLTLFGNSIIHGCL